MGKFDGVLLASDFDNTLVYTEASLRAGTAAPMLSEKNRQALEYFMAEGGLFSVATGRALQAFAPMAPMVPLNAPCVVCNGAAIYDWHAQEYREFRMLDASVLPRVQLVLDTFPEVAIESYHIDNVIHAVHPNDITRRHEHLTKVSTCECASMAEIPVPLGKVLFEAERPILEQVVALLTERGWADEYELIFSGQTLLELTAKGANKGGMVLRLAELLGVSREHIYCAGDESNDLPMLQVAAQGFAPANCVPAVRDSGVTVVSDAREDAIADIVAILDKKY